MKNYECWMRQALKLARRGLGRTSPNPAVGAVVLREDFPKPKVVGEGFHKKAGGPHAEVIALNKAGELSKGAVLFITLEPCCHYGKTPPCTDAIIKAGISKVVIATPDPNPLVNGKGIAKLKESGIYVIVGVCEKEANLLNEAFLKFIATGYPFVALKWAMTLDGKIATHIGDSKWISGEKARFIVHKLRNQYDAVMVGINTVIKDDPLLTSRISGGRNPARIIIDPKGVIPIDKKVVSSPLLAPTILVTCVEIEINKKKILEERGIEILIIPLKNDRPSISSLLHYLGKKNILSVIVEGGSGINALVLEEDAADKVYAFIAPKIVGGKDAKTPIEGSGISFMKDAWNLNRVVWQRVGDDLFIRGYFK